MTAVTTQRWKFSWQFSKKIGIATVLVPSIATVSARISRLSWGLLRSRHGIFFRRDQDGGSPNGRFPDAFRDCPGEFSVPKTRSFFGEISGWVVSQRIVSGRISRLFWGILRSQNEIFFRRDIRLGGLPTDRFRTHFAIVLGNYPFPKWDLF
jgi:hypothetical protein